MVRALPRDSAVAGALAPYIEWDHQSDLLAMAVNYLAILDWHFVMANTTEEHQSKIPTPELIERPHGRSADELIAAPPAPPAPRSKVSSNDDIRAFLGVTKGNVSVTPNDPRSN